MSEQHSKLGYSAVSYFNICSHQYKLRYIDKVKILDEYEATGTLKIGTALRWDTKQKHQVTRRT